MTDSLGMYLHSIGEVALLTAHDERDLAKIIETGRDAARRLGEGDDDPSLRRAVSASAAAKDRFIRANLRLVVSVARRYPLPPSMELGDLIQEGNIGLEHAVDKFDWRRGFKFSTYATFWIRQAIGRALDYKSSTIRIPADRSTRLRAALRRVEGDADALEGPDADAHRVRTVASLDRAVGDDHDVSLGDTIAAMQPTPEELLVSIVAAREVAGVLDVLDQRARFAVEARFGFIGGEQLSYRDIGEAIGVTGEAARRIVHRAMVKLREVGLPPTW